VYLTSAAPFRIKNMEDYSSPSYIVFNIIRL
jgi:hypothetical protein